jgi:PASTA domain
MSFPAIRGSSDPEEFSWEVELSEGQELQLVDSQHAMVNYVDGHHPAFGIAATPAHDASGATVPTSLAVSDGNVLTLTVHHRAGNPLADGAPFDYPVVSGSAWTAIGQGGTVPPPLELSVNGVPEQFTQANTWSGPARLSGSPQCLVPKLAGRSLAASRKRLRSAHCKIGRVRKRNRTLGTPGRVIKQSPRAGTVLAGGAKVNVTLAG